MAHRLTEQEHDTVLLLAKILSKQLPTQFRSVSGGIASGLVRLRKNPLAASDVASVLERYDADTRPHPHFCCDECGSVYDLDLPYDQEVDQRARLASGHDVRGHQVTFHGVCAQCRRTEKQVV